MVTPYHWSNIKSKISVVDLNPDLKISNTERGIFLQIDLDQYAPGKATIKLANDNTFMSYPMNQIQPNTFLTERLPHSVVENMRYIDVELDHENLLRETRFNYSIRVVKPGEEQYAFSNDRDCSIKTQPGTFTRLMLCGLNKSKISLKAKADFTCHRCINFNLMTSRLEENFKGIQYSLDLIKHSNLGIYYFDQKKEKWIYTETKNNQRKQILTAELEQMDAVTIIQDLDSPKIKMKFPGNGMELSFRGYGPNINKS